MPKDFPAAESVDFIWAHPPYWRMKLYADDHRDLSRSPTLEHFLQRYGQFIRNCAGSLKRGGKLAILMGDYSDREAGYVPLVYHTKRLAFAAGLTQHCTDIIRFSHGNSSSKKVYRSSFIPGLHDVAMIFEQTLTNQRQKGIELMSLYTSMFTREMPGLRFDESMPHDAANVTARDSM